MAKIKAFKTNLENYPNFKKDLEKFTDIILNEIKRALKRGDRVELRGSGVFILILKKQGSQETPKWWKVNTPEKKPFTLKCLKTCLKN